MNNPSEKTNQIAPQSGGLLPPLPTIWLGIFAAGATVSLMFGICLGALLWKNDKITQADIPVENGQQPNEVASVVASVKPEPVAEDAEQAIQADIEEAISLIDKRSLTILAHTLLHPQIRFQLEARHARSRGGTDAPQPLFDERQLETLKWHLQSSLNAELTFNRDKTIAELKYQLIQPDEPDFQIPKDLPAADRKPKKAVKGLGNDLTTMLIRAADLIEKDQVEEFINNVYPLPDLGRLEQGDAMLRHLLRVENEPMKAAMLRDLKAAAAAEAEVQGSIATVSLGPISQGDPDRQFKFELVENNWRFLDSNKNERAELVKLAGMPPAKINPKLEQGSMVMTLTNEGWRVTKLPD